MSRDACLILAGVFLSLASGQHKVKDENPTLALNVDDLTLRLPDFTRKSM